MKNGHGLSVFLYLSNSITQFYQELEACGVPSLCEVTVINIRQHTLQGRGRGPLSSHFTCKRGTERSVACVSGWLTILSLFVFSTVNHV